jgi:hypothetical protein
MGEFQSSSDVGFDHRVGHGKIGSTIYPQASPAHSSHNSAHTAYPLLCPWPLPRVLITPRVLLANPQVPKLVSQHAFLEGKNAGETDARKSTARTLKEVGQQYPSVK